MPAEVRLRRATLRDANAEWCAWVNDPTVHRYLSTRTATIPGLRRYIQDARKRGAWLAAICLPSGTRIGTVKVEFSPVDVGTVGIMIGHKIAWGKGYGTAALRAVVQLAQQWKLLSLRAGMMPGNLASVAAFRKAGFTVTQQPNGFWSARRDIHAVR